MKQVHHLQVFLKAVLQILDTFQEKKVVKIVFVETLPRYSPGKCPNILNNCIFLSLVAKFKGNSKLKVHKN